VDRGVNLLKVLRSHRRQRRSGWKNLSLTTVLRPFPLPSMKRGESVVGNQASQEKCCRGDTTKRHLRREALSVNLKQGIENNLRRRMCETPEGSGCFLRQRAAWQKRAQRCGQSQGLDEANLLHENAKRKRGACLRGPRTSSDAVCCPPEQDSNKKSQNRLCRLETQG